MLCPNCHAFLDNATLTCANEHRYARVDGVLVLMACDLAGRVAALEAALGQQRAANGPPLAPAVYAALPEVGSRVSLPGGALEWRLRRYDLAVIVASLAGRGRQRVLDVGAWNGWLSHRLAECGHTVTAIDYFREAPDGLRVHGNYPARWRRIQLDLRDPGVLGATFDVVIANRCLAFAPDPAAQVAALQQRVGPGGLLILTGLQFFWQAAGKARQVEAESAAFRARHGLDRFLFPTRGYLDRRDYTRLRAAGVSLRRYPQLWAADVRALWSAERPRHRYGVWVA